MSPRSDIRTVHERQLQPDPIKAADAFFTEFVGIHKMLVVDDNDRLRGLVTFSDVDRITAEAKSPRRPAVLMVLDGAARIGGIPAAAGSTVLVPAYSDATLAAAGNTRLLVAIVKGARPTAPDLAET